MIMNNLVFVFYVLRFGGGFFLFLFLGSSLWPVPFSIFPLKLYTPAGSARRFFYDIIHIRKLEIDGLTKSMVLSLQLIVYFPILRIHYNYPPVSVGVMLDCGVSGFMQK